MVVDSSGAALAALLEARPDVAKPNAAELAALMGREAALDERIAFARDQIVANRLAPGGYFLVSLGSEGAVLVFGDGAVGARPPGIRPVNTVGCGDALLAGYQAERDVDVTQLDEFIALRQVAFDLWYTGTAQVTPAFAAKLDDVHRWSLAMLDLLETRSAGR